MAKFENFLRRYSWLLQLGAWLILILWAPQTITGIVYMYKVNEERNVGRDYSTERKIDDEMRIFVNQIIRKADQKHEYRPSEYFQDFQDTLAFERSVKQKYSYFPKDALLDFHTNHWQQVSMIFHSSLSVNSGNKIFINELTAASKGFQDWQEKEGYKEKSEPWDGKEASEWMIHNFLLSWAVPFYLKGLLLALLIYLVRMANDDGILKTILSGKLKFFLAMVFWPKLVFDYPGYMIRKIHVEAEMRRLGDKFRKMSPMEQRIVREVAAKSRKEYHAWVKNFRESNSGKFQRDLLGCVLATLIIIALAPIAPAFAGERNIPSVSSIADWDPPPNESPPADIASLPEFWEMGHFQEASRLFLAEVLILIGVFPRKIDCVPNYGHWVREMFLQTT